MGGEWDLIAALSRMFGQPAGEVICGIGDDTAIVAPGPGYHLLWTIDALVEGVHFDLAYTPLEALGRKALAVNLSDIAAMGGEPQYALLALGWPPNRQVGEALDLARGMQGLALEYGVRVIGGDTVSSPPGLMISLTVLGRARPEEILRRDRAQAGDLIFVTGPLGQAAAGLEILHRGLALPEATRSPLLQAFLDPRPQVRAGRLLAENRLAHALIDLSDGVASDLYHICVSSRVGAVLEADQVPVSAEMQEVAALVDREPVDLALRGGEDYQLLFTSPPDREEAIISAFAQTDLPAPVCIGRITPGTGVRLHQEGRERDISGAGYEHFLGGSP